MLYHLFTALTKDYTILNVFKYITFRSALAMITALIITLVFGNRFIKILHNFQNEGQPIRLDGPQSHLSKKGTPTMGGLMLLTSIITATLLWVDLYNLYIWISLIILLSFGILGFIDDYLKIKYKNSKGISGKAKLFWQFSISFITAYLISNITSSDLAYKLTFPFFKNFILDLGFAYLILASIVITGASNAVNLTDGLDGLAIGPIIIASACFALICYLTGNAIFSEYLQIPTISGVGEVSILCAAIVGAGLGFLWFNAPPAQIFMGDVGSLSLGGALGVISVITKQEFLLAIIGGLFVIEALSVIIQVFCFKIWRYRPFKMAPIHHHYEKIGWSETKVVIRFWIIAIIFALLGALTLKIR